MNMSFKRLYLSALLSLSILFFPAFPWGREGHRIINVHAAALMPAPLDSFFTAYSDSLGLLGAEPDQWKKEDHKLINWHYIDLDLLDVFPFKKIPASYEEAKKRFGQKTLKRSGILPWAIEHHYEHLIRNFPKGKWKSVRNDLIGLAHYIGDGHQPLHVTVNYNGQKTDNPGVHFRFEIELLEKFSKKYGKLPQRYLISPRRKIKSLNRHSLDFMIKSFALVDSVNNSDIACKKGRPDYDSFYFACYEKKVGALSRRRLACAASQVAAYWYSAWLEAGKPKMKY